MSEQNETQGERWDRVGGKQFLKEFSSIENKRSERRDLHAFILLAELFPGDGDIVADAGHEKIYLDFGGAESERLTDDQIIELSRCGVLFEDEADSLYMFT